MFKDAIRLFAIVIGAIVLFACSVAAQTAETMVKGNYSDPVRPYLTDAEGYSLYIFEQDRQNQSACDAECAEAWPPLVGPAEAGEGVADELLGTITRADGSEQVTYNGLPLYRFAKDTKPGESNGEGANAMWFLMSPYGVAVAPPVEREAAAPAQNASPMGEAQASPAAQRSVGMSVYTSNCAVCHGAQGEGGTGPTLANNTSLEDTDLILSQVIQGGRVMPPFGDELSDAQIAAVATYIRSAWGNDYAPVTADTVGASR